MAVACIDLLRLPACSCCSCGSATTHLAPPCTVHKHCKQHLQLADMPIRVLTAWPTCPAAGAEEAMALTPILDSVMESPEGWESLVLATAKRQQPGAVASLLKLGLLHCRWAADQAVPWPYLLLCYVLCGHLAATAKA